MAAPQVFIDIDLTPQPLSGFGYYYPTVQVTDPTEGITLTSAPQPVAFDGTAKSIQLYATDNANMGPAGWAWFLDFSQNPVVPGKPSPVTFFAPAGPVSFTSAAGTPAGFTWTSNAAFMSAFPSSVLPNGTAVTLSAAPQNFSTGTTYYVVNSTALSFNLSATRGGPAIGSPGAVSGTITVTRYTYSGLVPQGSSVTYSPFLPRPAGAPASGYAVTADSGGNPVWSRVAQYVAATFRSMGLSRQTVYNVLDYGAAGDGAADDTTAFQNALTAAGNSGPGSKVWVPFTSAGYVCGALTIPPGVEFAFDKNARLTALATLAGSWITAQQNADHVGTAVTNGTFDATPVSAIRAVDTVIKFNGMTTARNIRVEGNTVINAPVHGIRIGELTATYGMKYVRGNFVNEHGIAPGGTGFGIYADYVGNVLIEGNVLFTAGNAGAFGDNIELGHSGAQYLGGLNTHLRCVNNLCVGGQINYPFSHHAEIVNNTVIAANGPGGIQNDGNTADHVQIIGNKVFGATPGAQYGGISTWGSYPQICDNYVQVASGNGIGGSWTNAVIADNKIETTAAAATGTAIYPGGGGTGNSITGNTATGLWNFGIHMPFTSTVVSGNSFSADTVFDLSNCKTCTVTGNTVSYVTAPFSSGVLGLGTIFKGNPGIAEYAAVTGAYTISITDRIVDCTSGTFTATLPSVTSLAGKGITVKNSGTGTITVACAASQKIDGVATVTLFPGRALSVTGTGSGWIRSGTNTREVVLHVKDFGAKGDGTTDDFTAINTAITLCSTLGGGEVFLPASSYYVSHPVVPASGVCIRGAGMYATTLLPSTVSTGANGDGIRLVASAGAYASCVTICDLTVDMSNSPQYASYQLGVLNSTYSNGMTLLGIDDLSVENVRVIKPWGYGVIIGSPDGNVPFVKRPRVKNLHILGARIGNDSLGGGGVADGLVDGLYVYPAADGTNPYGTAQDWTNMLNTTIQNVRAWTTFVQGPISAQVTPAVPPGATNLLNPFSFPVTITLTSGTVTACTINGAAQGLSGPWTLPGFGQISLSYPSTPTWSWAAPSVPNVPASGTPVTNPFAFPLGVTVSGGTVSAVAINGVPQSATSGYFLLPLAGTITLTYTAAPTWAWATTSPQNPGGIMTDFGAVNVRYTDCHINGWRYGIVVTKGQNKPYPQEIKIDHCDLVNVGYQGVWTNVYTNYGINEIEVTDCWIDKWGMTGSSHGIQMSGSQGFSVRDNRFGTPGNSSYCINLATDGAKGCNYGSVAGNDLHNNSQRITAASPGSSVFIRDNPGYNPVGVLTVAVPASGSPTAAQLTDAVFYVTAASSGTTTVAISGGPVITIPANACVPVKVPGGQTLTPSYTTAPTWVVEGE